MAYLSEITLPDFGLPTDEPLIPAEVYQSRLETLRRKSAGWGHHFFVVYADPGHAANMRYLTGFAPQQGEALLLLNIWDETRLPLLMIGDEPFESPIAVEKVIFPPFNPMGKPRPPSLPLREIWREFGLSQRVGVAGWKYFTPADDINPTIWLELPAYLADALRELSEDVQNANYILMDSLLGMRAINEVEQLAYFEYMAAHDSQATRETLFIHKKLIKTNQNLSIQRLKETERFNEASFETLAAWYEAVGIGMKGSELYHIIQDGYLLHLEGWMNTPFYAGSRENLQAGMVIVTPYTADVIALADTSLRATFATRYPEAWTRIQARRTFMQQELNIHLKPEVLPFSNLPAYLPPLLSAPERAFRR